MNTIYHNPNWSKSRKSVEILKNEEIEFKTIMYLKNPPTKNEIIKICSKLQCKPRDIIRKNEKDFKENNLNKILDNDDLLISKMIQFPKIIERPIIVINDQATIGRPPDNIYKIIK